MTKLVSALLAGALVLGAAGAASAQNLTPNLGLPPNAYLPPIDSTPYGWAFAPSASGRSVYAPRAPWLDRSHDAEQDVE